MPGTSLGPPEDDAFVRTAIRGMRPPDHEPSFWDRLASRLDAAQDARGIADVFGPPGSLEEIPPARPRAGERSRPAHRAPEHRVPEHRDPEHAPRRAPLRAGPAPASPPAAAPPAAPPAAAPGPASAPPRRQVHAAAATATSIAATASAAAATAVRKVDPLAGFKVRHDAATLPASMRRASNVVLLTIALAAILVAVIAGLSLLRNRSDAGAPTLPSSPAAAAPIGAGDLTGGPAETR